VAEDGFKPYFIEREDPEKPLPFFQKRTSLSHDKTGAGTKIPRLFFVCLRVQQ
jgi:hypothetical protein